MQKNGVFSLRNPLPISFEHMNIKSTITSMIVVRQNTVCQILSKSIKLPKVFIVDIFMPWSRCKSSTFWCFTLHRLNRLDLPAEVSFLNFLMWALKGPVMFGKVLGQVCKKRLNCAQKLQQGFMDTSGLMRPYSPSNKDRKSVFIKVQKGQVRTAG